MSSTASSAGVQLQQRIISVTTSATKLPTTPLVGRKAIMVQNLSTNPIYLGGATVTTTGATRGVVLITQYDFIVINLASNVDLYGIASGASDVAILEIV